MYHLKKFLFVLILLFFTHHSTQVYAGNESSALTQKGNINGGNLVMTLLSSFLIGNAVAWAMGAYPRDFELKPYSAYEADIIKDLTFEIEQHPNEADSKVELGELYFQHNDLNNAQTLLGQAVKLEPGNGEALAIYSANEAKQAGAMLDITWGVRKLNRMSTAVSGLNRAVEIAPDNFKIRLYRMNTLVGFKNIKGSFHKVFDDEKWFLERLETSSDQFPVEVNRSFYRALVGVYQVDAELTDSQDREDTSLKKVGIYQMMLNPIDPEN